MRESRKITIRLKPEEFQLIEREAERRNWSLSEVARHLMLQKLDSVSDLSDVLARLDEFERRLRQVEGKGPAAGCDVSGPDDPFSMLNRYEVGELCKNLVRNEAARYVQKERRRGLNEAEWVASARAQLPQLLRRGLSRRNLSVLGEMLGRVDAQNENTVRAICEEVAALIETTTPAELRERYPGAARFVPLNFTPNVLVRPLATRHIFERDPRWTAELNWRLEDPRS